MASDILKIKVNIPPLGKNILFRTHILKQLEEDLTVAEGFARQLTLFSAPAGFGKTTLARTWLANREERACWYSLDEGDNARERFWIYLITALQTINSSVGIGSMEMLRSLSLPKESSTSLLTPLLNDLFTLEVPLILILDDYHLINNSLIHRDMTFFIENLPPMLHLAVTTRSDPPWPLARWRAKNRISEIRLGDLKFSQEEAGQLFARLKGLQLSEAQLKILHQKTEGWVTGLQLAAFSLSTSSQRDAFVESFAGSHRHVLHFLSEEVLANQPEPVQDFLLETSILNRFCGELCNAVTGRVDSSDLLDELERHNLFVIPLDDQGIWYRYHHLFADLLLYQLKKSSSVKPTQLHERAGSWFLEAGEIGEAIRHGLSAKNFDNVAKLLDLHFDKILQEEGTNLLALCLESFSGELLERYPRLVVYKAFLCLVRKGIREFETYLNVAESLSYDNEREQQEYIGILTAIKAFYSIHTNSLTEALENAEKALALLPETHGFWRISIAVFAGDARLFSGNPKDAYTHYMEAYKITKKMRNHSFTLSTSIKVAISLYYLGRLQEAEELIQKNLKVAKEEGYSKLSKVGNLWTLLGELLREKGSLDEAERCVERGLLLSEPERAYLGWNYIFKIALYFSMGDYTGAINCVRQIEAINDEVKLPFFISFAATTWEARILVKLGKISSAKALLSKIGISEDNQVQGGKEKGYLVLSRILLEENKDGLVQARIILKQIEELAAAGGHKAVLLEAQLLSAQLEEKTGSLKVAEGQLNSALKSGMEAGFFQMFLDQEKHMAPILSKIVKKFIQKPSKPQADSCQGLVEELTSRELEILGLVGQGLSNQDISKKLFLSLGTVKWHTSNIYGKLGVRGRTQALIQARELKLIP